MGSLPKCRVSLGRYTAWHRQVLSGFYDLATAGGIDLSVDFDRPDDGLGCVLTAVVDDRLRVTYDMNDGYNFLQDEPDWVRAFDRRLDACDVYFKYTCIDEVNAPLRNRDKIRPLGPISIAHGSRNNLPDRGAYPFDARLFVKNVLSATRWTARLAGRSPREAWADRCEFPPTPGAEARAVFVSRAFDISSANSDERAAEYESLNTFRADVIRLGRAELGPRFFGGFEAYPYARRAFPAYVLETPEGRTRHAYVDLVRGSQVGMTTRGLHLCASSKLAEYLAMSRAIVTQTILSRMPGDFADDTHVVSADTPEGLVEEAARLLDDPEAVERMMRANQAYYERYVRPAAMVWRTLEEAMAVGGEA